MIQQLTPWLTDRSRRPRQLPVTRPIRSAVPTFAQEPISLAEAKKQCDVAEDISYHDSELIRLISEARESFENDSGMAATVAVAWTWKLTDWPCCDWIEIPLRPIASITSITYVDTAGATQTWTSTNYALDTSAITPIIRLTYGNYFPSLRGDIGGITITLTAGYTDVLAIPPTVKHAVRMAVQKKWEKLDTDKDWEGYERQIRQNLRSTYP